MAEGNGNGNSVSKMLIGVFVTLLTIGLGYNLTQVAKDHDTLTTMVERVATIRKELDSETARCAELEREIARLTAKDDSIVVRLGDVAVKAGWWEIDKPKFEARLIALEEKRP